MPRPIEETDIAYCTVMLMFASEDVLLDVCNTLHDESDRPEDNTSYIPPSSKFRLSSVSLLRQRAQEHQTYLTILSDIRRIQKSHWE